MFPSLLGLRRVAAQTLIPGLLLATGSLASAQSEDAFYQAYFLENDQQDWSAAARAYEKILDDRRAPEELKNKARIRLAICREELVSADFAQLMPPTLLAYIELDEPGERMRQVLSQLGLLRAATEQMEASDVGVSPLLVESVLGLRGAAVAITGFNPMTEEPMGVGVLHPGDLDLVRGLIETALPAEAERLDDIEGYEAYSAEHLTVVLTSRLVVAGNDRGQVRKVLQRLNGELHESLASEGELLRALGDREGALLSFLINPEPIMPLVDIAVAADPEAATWMQLADPKSLETLAGSLSLGREGVALELALDLEEGHTNRVFHFLRMPAIQKDTLERIPAGVTGFVAAALNDARSYSEEAGDTYLSFMDVGREVFGNLTSFAVFALPDESASEVPHVGAVLSVNDPAASASLWGMALGMASLAGGGSLEGEVVHVAGVEARGYRLPDGPMIYGAMDGAELFLATSEKALAGAIETGGKGASVLEDKAFAEAIEAMTGHETLAVAVHGERMLRMMQPWADGEEAEQMRQLAPRLADSVMSLAVSHSPERLGVRLALTHLPKVGDLIAAQLHGSQAGGYVAHGAH